MLSGDSTSMASREMSPTQHTSDERRRIAGGPAMHRRFQNHLRLQIDHVLGLVPESSPAVADIKNMDSDPILTGCTFTGNSAASGGGIGNLSGNPTLTDCTFNANVAGRGGGPEFRGIFRFFR